MHHAPVGVCCPAKGDAKPMAIVVQGGLACRRASIGVRTTPAPGMRSTMGAIPLGTTKRPHRVPTFPPRLSRKALNVVAIVSPRRA
jgi:hypothetical protein